MKDLDRDARATVRRLWADVSYLASPELDGRAPGTEGHELAAVHIEAQMEELRLGPLFPGGYGQAVPNRDGYAGLNLCGMLPGRTDRKLLIGAHYDTHPDSGPGADDNAAAVAIALEVARRLSPWNGDASIVFAFFDQEEPPHFHEESMGSLFYAEHPPHELATLECTIIMDLCGHDLPSITCPAGLIVMGAEQHQALVEVVDSADREDLPLIAIPHELEPDFSDHYAFRRRGVPFLFLTCGRWQHYHKPSDGLENLNMDKMGGIAASVERMVRALDAEPPGRLRAQSPAFGFVPTAARGYERITGRHAPADPAEMYARAMEWAESTGLR
jgi:hypothetical protein